MMQTRMILMLGCAALVAFTPATEGFSSPASGLAPSAGLVRDLTRGRLQLRRSVRQSSAVRSLCMQAQAEPPKDPG